jgi:hypothetical protein
VPIANFKKRFVKLNQGVDDGSSSVVSYIILKNQLKTPNDSGYDTVKEDWGRLSAGNKNKGQCDAVVGSDYLGCGVYF